MKAKDFLTEQELNEALPAALGAIGAAALRAAPRIAGAAKKGVDAIRKSGAGKKLKKWGDEILDVSLDTDGNSMGDDGKSLGDVARDAAEFYRKNRGKQK